MFDQMLLRVRQEIQDVIRNAQNSNRTYAHESGRRLKLSEAIHQGTLNGANSGAIIIFYSPQKFMTVDRLLKLEDVNSKFKKMRRIIYYLDSRTGQIGSTLLLELLKLQNGESFSKTKFIQKIDQEFFSTKNIPIGEINESLSRMLRKTMNNFFEIHGKQFKKSTFTIYFQELNKNLGLISEEESYSRNKVRIDSKVNHYLNNLRNVRS